MLGKSALLCVLLLLILALGLYEFIGDPRNGDIQKTGLNKFFWRISSTKTHWNTQNIEWAAMLRQNYRVILEEFLAFENKHKGIDMRQAWGLEKNNKWKTLVLVMGGMENRAVSKEFPKTMGLIRQTPMSTIMFSEMHAGAYLPPHYGEFKGNLRYHLGLEIANSQKRVIPLYAKYCKKKDCRVPPIYLGVVDYYGDSGIEKISHRNISHVDYLTWKTGEDLLFDDNYPHFVKVGSPDIPRFDIPWLPRLSLVFVAFFIAPYLVGVIQQVLNEQTKGLAAVGITSDWGLYALNSLWEYSFPRILVAILLVVAAYVGSERLFSDGSFLKQTYAKRKVWIVSITILSLYSMMFVTTNNY